MSPTRRAVNLATLLTQTAQRLPDHDAIVHGEQRWTWQQLDAGVSALARELTARGVRAGDCVLLHSANHVELVQAMFATWRIGAILAPTNCRLTPSDVTVIAKACRPALLFCHADQRDHATAIAKAVDTLRGDTLWIGGTGADAIGDIPRRT
jgi:acyl-CoA synthetase (AMP-forming)/AMP-acid ligase II